MIDIKIVSDAKTKLSELKSNVSLLDEYQIRLLKSIESFLKNDSITEKQYQLLNSIHAVIFDKSWDKPDTYSQGMNRLREKYKEEK